MMIKKVFFETVFGQMIAVADSDFLLLLQFVDSSSLSKQIDQIQKLSQELIIHGSNAILTLLARQLEMYCEGTLKKFTIPIKTFGTEFQNSVWQGCARIEYGSTMHYKGLAELINYSQAYRAVGTALGANCHVLIVPCHRIVQSNGSIGEYGGGSERKKLLLEHERFFKNTE